MNFARRYRLASSALAVTTILAACGVQATPETASPTASPTPSVAPSAAPSDDPSAGPKVAGTITVADGLAFSGPGVSVSEALASSTDQPTLVNGALWLHPDGTLYLAQAVADATQPTFDEPMLEVLDLPQDAAAWDPANAEDTGLQRAGGVTFFETYQILGTVES